MWREKVTHYGNSNPFNIVPIRPEVVLIEKHVPNEQIFQKFMWRNSPFVK